MGRLWVLARRHGLDVLVVLLASTATLELVLRAGSAGAPRIAPWVGGPALALLPLPLLARRRFPFAAPCVYWLLATVLSFVDGRLVPFSSSVYLLGMAAAFLLGSIREVRRARLGLVVVLAATVVIVHNLPGHGVTELLFIPLIFGISWVAGWAVHQRAVEAEAAEDRAAQAERERDAAARLAVAEERVRIARELHDVVAHAVSVMVLQVGAVRHGLPAALAEDREALTGVEQVGRTALTEMRRLLVALRREEDGPERTPQPGLDDLDALVLEITRAGLPVRVEVEGRPVALPRAIDLSAYRIVQEGLTNALRHARATRAEVTLGYEPGQLQLQVRDDGVGAIDGDGLGHGLLGVRERVKIYGGDLVAGPGPVGGFLLKARLPLGGDRP
jgi:signal transduction histidine kinase